MLCQGKKRVDWQERLSKRLLNVPYAHITFTLPSELHPLARSNPKVIYQMLMRSAWQTIKILAAKEENLGALPGMISVLHTWGSDLKYHLHAHTLVSFGGLDKALKWRWPKRRKKIAPFRELCKKYREVFLGNLANAYRNGQIQFHKTYEQIEAQVENKRWVVNHQRPTANTWLIENYLAKYICRSAVTAKRLKYDDKSKMVSLLYNDYAKQKPGQIAPKGLRSLHPLDAIHAILKHKLPPYFQRSRYYGIHSSATYKKIKDHISDNLKRDPRMIKILFSLMRELLDIPAANKTRCCANCGSIQLHSTKVKKDELWIYLNVNNYKIRSPPSLSKYHQLKN
jgi:hypothetical protein